MKLVIRADDFGFTKVLNDGLLKAVENGVVTTIDIMLDTPGFEDAAERMKQYPWISTGWHTHFYWKPVLPPEQVSSLLDPETGRFKNGLTKSDDVDENEVIAECRAEVERCIRIMGKAPDTTDLNDTSVFEKARKKVCDEYGIIYHFAEKHMKTDHILSEVKDGKQLQETMAIGPSEKYKHLDIYFPTDIHSLKYVHQDSAEEFTKYDPVQYYIDDPDNMKAHKISVMPWHPGYTDEFIFRIYDNPLFNSIRSRDIEALCSDRMKQWIRENHVELVNYRDAIFGTKEYQNHLKAIGSDLAI